MNNSWFVLNLRDLSFREKCCSKTSGLNILDPVQGFCENLSAVGFSDNSVDAVVVTLVLCSVKDQEKSISEIRRVLKPGGKFFYMEHILADESRQWHRMFQKALMTGGFWPFVADGCCTDRSTGAFNIRNRLLHLNLSNCVNLKNASIRSDFLTP